MVRPAAIGRVIEESEEALERYLAHLRSAVTTPLDGIRVVVDCANGAAFKAAPEAYKQAGADVVAIHNEPNSFNINDGVGSTHIEVIQKAVTEHHADLGLAHDGDATVAWQLILKATLLMVIRSWQFWLSP